MKPKINKLNKGGGEAILGEPRKPDLISQIYNL
jgi:hypothetical protein